MEYILFTVFTYLPIILFFIGMICFVQYIYLRNYKKKYEKRLLIIGSICVLFIFLYFLAFFLAGAMGIGPVPS